jgi:phage repressor protein C with HTH and peptisase S24 domain
LGERFRREAQTLLGRDPFEPNNWEIRLFSRFVEAFEITAAQRGAPRWEAGIITEAAPRLVRPTPSSTRYAEDDLSLPVFASPSEPASLTRLTYSEIPNAAFKSALPILGSFAAGDPFQGFEAGSLDDLQDLEWVEVPPKLAAQRRFVVRVAGDSMQPALAQGDLAVFEYHRTPRRQGQIVIAFLPETYEHELGSQTIKRIYQEDQNWILRAENPRYADIIIPAVEIKQPILGIFVQKLDVDGASE